MENENYASVTIWVHNKESLIESRTFVSGPRYYLIELGHRAGAFATEHLCVLEAVRDAAIKLIAEFQANAAVEASLAEAGPAVGITGPDEAFAAVADAAIEADEVWL